MSLNFNVKTFEIQCLSFFICMSYLLLDIIQSNPSFRPIVYVFFVNLNKSKFKSLQFLFLNRLIYFKNTKIYFYIYSLVYTLIKKYIFLLI